MSAGMPAAAAPRFSPTSLRVLAENCPRALQFYLERAPVDRDVFATGTVAHALIEDVAKETIRAGRVLEEHEVREVCDTSIRRVLSQGRRHEPPPPPDAALEGRSLAVRWCRLHPILPDATAEQRLAVTREWTPCDWDDERARFRLILDCAFTVEDFDEEGSGGRILVVRDYKSAWTAGGSDLDSLQMRAQAVFAWLAIESSSKPEISECTGIRVEIANLRTGRIHSRDLWPWSSDEDSESLMAWRDDLAALMDSGEALAEQGYPARPGVRCMSCLYADQCEAAWSVAQRAASGDMDDPISALCVADALTTRLRAAVRELTKHSGPIKRDGHLVGYVERTSREVVDDAPARLVRAWLERAGQEPDSRSMPTDAVLGLLESLRIGVGSLESAAKTVCDDRDQRLELLAGLVREVTVPRFGVWRDEVKP